MHLWFQLPQVCIAKNWTSQSGKFPVDGVDIRTNGGLATMPPSDRGDGIYSWLDWVPTVPLAPLAPLASLEALKPKPYERRSFNPLTLRTSDSASRYGETALQSELERVLRSPIGSRNDSLFLASAKLGSLHAAGIIPDVRGSLERAACACGLSADDGARASRMTIDSGWLRGLESPRRIERELEEKYRPQIEERDAAAEIAKLREKAWKAAVQKALRDGETPPPKPSDARVPAPVRIPRTRVMDTTIEKLVDTLQHNENGVLVFQRIPRLRLE